MRVDTRVVTKAHSSYPGRVSVISFLLIAAIPCFAQLQMGTQSPNSASDPPQPTGSSPTPHDRVLPAKSEREIAKEQIKEAEKQRILGIVPQFNVPNVPDAVRLSPGQKFELALKSAVDPFTFVFSGMSSGISQAQNSFPGYGQGAEGYAKRFAASYVDSFDGTMIGNAMLPIVLHQDPRYFRKGSGSVASRIGYAIFSTFRCKGDSGHWQPNFSNLLGNFAAGGISNLYYPAGDRSESRAVLRAA